MGNVNVKGFPCIEGLAFLIARLSFRLIPAYLVFLVFQVQ